MYEVHFYSRLDEVWKNALHDGYSFNDLDEALNYLNRSMNSNRPYELKLLQYGVCIGHWKPERGRTVTKADLLEVSISPKLNFTGKSIIEI